MLCNGKESVRELRELAAGIIISNPHKFTTSVLGKTIEDYMEWILKDDSWGGTMSHQIHVVECGYCNVIVRLVLLNESSLT